MAHGPREKNTIRDSIENRLKGTISGLTNFTPTSFNRVWTDAFSEEFRDTEVANTAAYLSGLIDYSGGPITEDDLRTLGIQDKVDPDELNEVLEDDQLEELVKIVGRERDPGTKSTGTVTFTTVSSGQKTIPSDTTVGTQPDSSGDFLEFVVASNSDITVADGVTSKDVDILASNPGTEYNVGSGTITYLPDPPVGVQSVTNAKATSGGKNEETNEELRERSKDAIFETSGGGTVKGITGFIEDNVDGVKDVTIDEKFTGDSWHGNYPHGHIVVNGGTRSDILDAIDSSRPVSVRHFFVRPTIHSVSIDSDVIGSDVDTSLTVDSVEDYLSTIGLGDDVVEDKIIQAIMNSDPDIDNIDSLDYTVKNEELYFNQETLDDFEDGDIAVTNRFWNDWSGDTGSFASQTGTSLNGSYSGELSSSNEDVSVSTTRTSETTDSFEVSVQIDLQTGNSSDVVAINFSKAATALGSLEFLGNGDVRFSANSNTVITSWSNATEYTATIQWDFDNDEAEVTVDGSTSSNLTLSNSVSDWDTVELQNNTNPSGSTVNAFVDDFYVLGDTYTLGLEKELVSDGISDVTGTVNGSSVTFTEGTDYDEADALGGVSGQDSIRWILSGDRPDIDRDLKKTIKFSGTRNIYTIDRSMINEGIRKVEDADGTVYTEGTDWEEQDTTNDGVDDGIEWLSGGSSPDNDEEFTVTYDASTTAQVDYDITEGDIEINEDEEGVSSGNINITVL